MKKKILLMDNAGDFLDTQSRLLEKAGYQVLRAGNLQEAKDLLLNRHVHLGILDIRMLNDDDPRDITGLLLAQKEEYSLLPKIILTGHPKIDSVREALRSIAGGPSPAVDYVDKADGPKPLDAAIDRVFQQHIHINWDLTIQPGERTSVTLTQLAELIRPGLRGEQLLDGVDELEELLRRLFDREKMIRIERLLWQRRDRVALLIFAFNDGRTPEERIVVCGTRARIVDEAIHYREFAPAAPGNNATVLLRTGETLRLGANVYALRDLNLQQVRSLAEAFRTESEKSFHANLRSLFDHTLASWNKEQPLLDERRSYNDYYQEYLGLNGGPVSLPAFEERMQKILCLNQILGAMLECDSGRLTLRLGWQSFTYQDPVTVFQQAIIAGTKALLSNTPGLLSGENVLVDADGRTWLSDFGHAGLAPLPWHFNSLEAAVRFDWIENEDLSDLFEMERSLIGNNFSSLEMGDVCGKLRKQLRAIQVIRRLSTRSSNDLLSYHWGMFFQAFGRLANFNLPLELKRDRIRAAHLLLASAMIGDLITNKSQKPTDHVQASSGLRIDKETHTVWRDGSRIPMRGQAYHLLLGFYERSNQLCSRRAIIEQFLGEKYFEDDIPQDNRLNTAIRRLREKIEYDPDNPRFLVTEPGGGYRLMPH